MRLGEWAHGKRFLNLFAYTGAATVHAVGGGAIASTTVDMSRTYLDWAWRNLDLNDLRGPAHEFIQADCLPWLEAQSQQIRPPAYDLIFIDPPTHSRSKRMQREFDVQMDHGWLLPTAAKLLAPGGTIVFSNNFQKFKLDGGRWSTSRSMTSHARRFRRISPATRRSMRVTSCGRRCGVWRAGAVR